MCGRLFLGIYFLMSLLKLSHFVTMLVLFVCVWLQFVMLATNVNSSDHSNLAMIFNGVKVRSRSGKWPFIAAIKVPGATTTKCGGIVLNEDTILTAAHCLIKQKPKDYIVYIGHENIANTNPKYVFYPDKFIIHRNFDREGKMDNDIGVIKLRNKINIKNLTNVAWVCLPTSEDDSIVDTKHCYVIGWGYNENYKLPHDLFDLELPILDEEICNANPWFMKKYMLCAGYLKGGRDACNGDSGGPLVCPFKSDRKLYSLRGIVSFGNKCAQPNEPGYYTKVTNYLKWIKVHALD